MISFRWFPLYLLFGFAMLLIGGSRSLTAKSVKKSPVDATELTHADLSMGFNVVDDLYYISEILTIARQDGYLILWEEKVRNDLAKFTAYYDPLSWPMPDQPAIYKSRAKQRDKVKGLSLYYKAFFMADWQLLGYEKYFKVNDNKYIQVFNIYHQVIREEMMDNNGKTLRQIIHRHFPPEEGTGMKSYFIVDYRKFFVLDGTVKIWINDYERRNYEDKKFQIEDSTPFLAYYGISTIEDVALDFEREGRSCITYCRDLQDASNDELTDDHFFCRCYDHSDSLKPPSVMK